MRQGGLHHVSMLMGKKTKEGTPNGDICVYQMVLENFPSQIHKNTTSLSLDMLGFIVSTQDRYWPALLELICEGIVLINGQ